MDIYSLYYSKLKKDPVNELGYLSKSRQENQINEEGLSYNIQCNYKLFFFIVQLQQKLKDVEKENERLKHLLKKYNKETITRDHEMIKKVLLVISFLIFIIIFFLF
ncbi:conserved Plasmodium protein, unknown function [Plasmodium ovale]|uniref:Uncharacterized protein n=1 Tax=Plasmodium ovale TaxID=36330 RepID=A0A1D3TKB9_PLAOA|nr:conserved Plasmodium protein, unknown function [Plasmodium ovale]